MRKAAPSRLSLVAPTAKRGLFRLEHVHSGTGGVSKSSSAARQGSPHQVHVINPDSTSPLYDQVEPDQIWLLPRLQEKRGRDHHPAHSPRDWAIKPAGEELSLARNAHPHLQKAFSVQVLRLQAGLVDEGRVFDVDIRDLKKWNCYRLHGVDSHRTLSIRRGL